MIKSQTDRQTDRQKAMHMSPPCIRTGGLKKSKCKIRARHPPPQWLMVRPLELLHFLAPVLLKGVSINYHQWGVSLKSGEANSMTAPPPFLEGSFSGKQFYGKGFSEKNWFRKVPAPQIINRWTLSCNLSALDSFHHWMQSLRGRYSSPVLMNAGL